MRAVADSSFVIAIENDEQHNREECRTAYDQCGKIYLPQSTLNEVAYFLTREGGNRATTTFLKRLPETKYMLECLLPEDLSRITELLEKYSDTRLDFVDASVAAVAERLNITTVLTLDRRDFSLIRPKHVDYFAVPPSDSA
ncbi:MAG: PIN domain-containing protein [Chitinophagaceae bacterium]|nr:PIN domain-containing protein [Anaerolineae bacterium]